MGTPAGAVASTVVAEGRRSFGGLPRAAVAGIPVVAAVITGLAAALVAVHNVGCVWSPFGCPTAQVANLTVEEPAPWDVKFGEWRAAQEDKGCSVSGVTPDSQAFGLDVPFRLETTGFMNRTLLVKGRAVYGKVSAPLAPPAVTTVALIPKSESRRVVCSIFVQYPDTIGLSGWSFLVYLDVFDSAGSRLDSARRQVTLQPITLVLNQERLTNGVINIKGRVWFPLKRLVTALGWRFDCAKNCVRDGKAVVGIDGRQTELSIISLSAREAGGGESWVGFVELNALSRDLNWKQFEWRPDRELIITTM